MAFDKQTKLGALCEKILEAGWLVALIVVPTFFNIYSSRVYEPDKLTFLRSVAVVMIAVWAIRLIEREGGGLWGNGNGSGRLNVGALIKDTPLVLPTMLLVGVYFFTTVASIVPRTSFWGSYQRLQGTYTTLSYIVIFALMLQTLRHRAQIDRLVALAILVSVPVSFYGILQHYGKDPLPWVGDVVTRVASNMGNSIFVAAYLIMIAPLTWARAFDAFAALLLEEEGSTADVIRGAIYVFVAALQAITIYWTGSRGPQLGFLAGGLFFLLVLAFVRRWRWLIWITVGLGVVGVVFLLALNYGPLESIEVNLFNVSINPIASLKANAYIGRLGRVFETEGGTGKVRVLIWEGAIDLILPHPPLEYPEGPKDALNFARPFIGYGPEAMWVAYNRFYPPDLAHYEARNASPDRSHNETFDALVITGVVGFLVYMLLFASVFYYGFKWLGLIRNKQERNLFAALWASGAVVGSVASGLYRPEFIGVGLPLGIIVGVGLYLVIVTTFLREEVEPPSDRWYQLLLIALISAVIAHFVEIHFGIAIAATRTYFWTYAALLVVIGYGMTRKAVPSEVSGSVTGAPGTPRSRRKRRRRGQPIVSPESVLPKRANWLGPLLAYSLLVSFLLVVLVYDFVTNQARETAVGDIIWHSLTTKLVSDQMVPTYGVISMLVLVWWLGGGLVVAEMSKADMFKGWSRDTWARAFLVYLPIPPLVALLYAIWHVGALRRTLVQQSLTVIQASNLVTGVLVVFYVMAFLLLLAIGLALFWQENVPKPRLLWRGTASWVHLPILLVAAVIIWLTNINVIRADMIFKQGDFYDRNGAWHVSVEIYEHALDVAPHEDQYYLFLGRAYLELAKDPQLEPAQRLAVLEECRKALERARALNPLNTDHSANLARLYHSWANFSGDENERASRFEQSLKYYDQATSLSPHNAVLFNEWATVYMTIGRFDEALKKYEQSLALDQGFDMTYFGLADAYYNQGQLEQAAEMYEKGLALNPQVTQAWSFLGVIYARLGRHDAAIEATLKVIEQRPGDFDALKNLALIYRDMGQLEQALAYAQTAAQARPDYAPAHQLLGELYRAARDWPNAEAAYRQALELNPQDANILWALGLVYWDQSRFEEAIVQLEAAFQFVPGNLQVQQALGDLYVKTARWQKAIEAYESVLAAQPDQVQVRSALAHAYAQVGQLEDAVAQTLQVLEVAPNDFVSHKNLAVLYQQLGRMAEALAEAEAALELAPDSEREAITNFISELRQAQGL